MKRQPDNLDVIDDEAAISGEEMERLTRLIAGAVARELKDRVSVNYTEGSNERLLKWLLGVVSVLLCAFIIGSVVGYGNIQALRAVQEGQQRVQEGQQRQIDWLINRLTGEPNAPPR